MNGLFKEWRFWLPIAIIAIGTWTTVQFKAGAALSREDAGKTYVTITAHEKCEAARDTQLLEMRKLLQETHDAVIRLEAQR